MSVEKNKTLALKIIEDIFNGKAMDNLDLLVSLDIVVHDTDKELFGLEALRIGIGNLHTAFPDLKYTVMDMLAEGDKVALRAIGEGTNMGPFRGMAATGKSMRYTAMLLWRFQNDRLAEHWAVSDAIGIFQQLGATLIFPERN